MNNGTDAGSEVIQFRLRWRRAAQFDFIFAVECSEWVRTHIIISQLSTAAYILYDVFHFGWLNYLLGIKCNSMEIIFIEHSRYTNTHAIIHLHFSANVYIKTTELSWTVRKHGNSTTCACLTGNTILISFSVPSFSLAHCVENERKQEKDN